MTMICYMTTGELLKAWREKAGLTQEEFAEVAGVSRGYVGNYERDRASPSVRTLLMFIGAIEKSYVSFGRVENERLAVFFLGPAREGTLIVAKETIPLGRRR
jgi:transcriptional regulator with XRE-family HTH domain